MTTKRLKFNTIQQCVMAELLIKQKATILENDNKYYQLNYMKEFRKKDINGNSYYNFTILGIDENQKICNISKVIAGLFNLKYDDKKQVIVGYDDIPENIGLLWSRLTPKNLDLKLELVL